MVIMQYGHDVRHFRPYIPVHVAQGGLPCHMRCFTSESSKSSSSPTRPRNMSTVRISAIEASTASLVHLERTLVRFRTVLVRKLVMSCFPLAFTVRFALYLLMSKKFMVTCVYQLCLVAFTTSISLCRLS